MVARFPIGYPYHPHYQSPYRYNNRGIIPEQYYQTASPRRTIDSFIASPATHREPTALKTNLDFSDINIF